jgi:hypothetical protein
LLCFVYGLEKENTVWLIASGFFLFALMQTRVTSMILAVPMFITALVSSKRNVKALLLPGATVLLLYLATGISFWLLGGDPFSQVRRFDYGRSSDGDVSGLGSTFYWPRFFTQINFNYGFLFHLGLLAIPFGFWYSRKRDSVLLSLNSLRLSLYSFLTLVLFWEVGVFLIAFIFIFTRKLDRYLTIITIPAVVLIGGVASYVFLKHGKHGTKIKMATFGLISLQVGLSIAMIAAFGQRGTQVTEFKNGPYKRVIQELATYQNQTIGVLNIRWITRGEAYARLEGIEYDFQDLHGVTKDELRPGTIVIFDTNYFSTNPELPENLDDFPALIQLPENANSEWKLLFEDYHYFYGPAPVYVYEYVGQITAVH